MLILGENKKNKNKNSEEKLKILDSSHIIKRGVLTAVRDDGS